MKGLVFERNGEPSDVLSWRALPDPKVGANEVLVRMRLAPVHPSDLHVIRGRFARQPALPASPGGEGMGVVEAVGAEVRSVQVGTRVALLDVPGTRSDLLKDPRYATATLRRANLASLMAEVRAWILTFTDLDQLQAQVSEVGLAIGVVRSTNDIAASEWARDWGAIVEVDDRDGGKVRMPGPPWRFSRSTLPAPGLPYFQGENNAEVLSQRGVSAQEQDELRRRGVVLSRRSPVGAFD